MGDKKDTPRPDSTPDDTTRDDRFAALQKAVEERDRFLAARPHLQELQEEINETLRRAGNSTNRLSMLDSLLREKAGKLTAALQALTETFSEELGIEPASENPPPSPPDEPEPDEQPRADELPEMVEPDEMSKIIGPADAWPQKDQSATESEIEDEDKEEE